MSFILFVSGCVLGYISRDAKERMDGKYPK